MVSDKTKAVLVRMTPELHKKLSAKAKKENRTLNNYIVTVLMDAAK